MSGLTRVEARKAKTLTRLIAEQTAAHQILVRFGFRDNVESLIRAAYRLGYANGKAKR